MRRMLIGIAAWAALGAAAFGASDAPRVTLTFEQAKLGRVLEMLSKKTGIRLITGQALADKVITTYLEDMPADEAIDAVLSANGLYREKMPGSEVFVVNASKATEVSMVSDTVPLANARAGDMIPILKAVGFEKNISADARTNSLVVKDSAQNVQALRQLVAKLDVDHTKSPIRTEMIKLRYSAVADIWPALQAVLWRGEDVQGEASELEIKAVSSSSITDKPEELELPTQSTSSSTTEGGAPQTVKGTLDERFKSFGVGRLNEKQTLKIKVGKNFLLVPHQQTNSIVVVGTDDFQKQVKDLIAKLDCRVPQVAIEAVLVEMSENALKDIGIKWNVEGTFAGASRAIDFPWGVTTYSTTGTTGTGTGTGTGTTTATAGPGLVSFAGLTATLKLLQERGEANILAHPRVTTLNDSPATIRITRNIPIAPKVTTTSTGGTGTTVEEFEYRDVGITLIAVPHVNENGYIVLEVEPKVITAAKSANFENTVETSERSSVTKVALKDGETLVIGGLLRSETTKTDSRVPVLGAVLPFLFSNKSKSVQKTDLVMFLTLKVLSDEDTRAMARDEKARIGDK